MEPGWENFRELTREDMLDHMLYYCTAEQLLSALVDSLDTNVLADHFAYICRCYGLPLPELEDEDEEDEDA